MFDGNNICQYAVGEDCLGIICNFGRQPEHIEKKNCGKNVCKYYNRSLPDMREKIKEYIEELDAEIERLDSAANSMTTSVIFDPYSKTPQEYTNLCVERAAYIKVRNDLQSRLEELA